ncbi:MAG: DUF3187 family protein [Pseudomonadales bacterium]
MAAFVLTPIILLLAVLAPAMASAQPATAPLTVRNLAPVSQLYGIPGMLGGQRCCEGTQVSFRLAQASNFTARSANGAQVFFDGETTVAEYQFRGSFGRAAEWGLTLPLLMHSGGFLDSGIDGFHNAFGLPEGGRDLARRNQLDYLVRVDGETFARVDSTQRGFGDVRAWLGLALRDTAERAVMVRGAVKLPSGRAARLTGSEAVDGAAWVEWSERQLLHSVGVVVNAGIGASVLGDGELSPDTQESYSWFWHFGLARTFGEKLTLVGQVDGHSQLHDRGVSSFGGRALLGTLGARYQVTDKFSFDFSMVEDLKTRSAADVIFQLQLNARF